MKNNSSNSLFWIIIIVIVAVMELSSCVSCKNEHSSFYYSDPSVRKVIDSYNDRHKDDWKGYQGTRRNSFSNITSNFLYIVDCCGG
mgnify:CR=1 FL=1